MKQSICISAVFLFLAITGSNVSAEDTAVNPTGTWKWVEPTNTDNPNSPGEIPKITFTLKLQGETLTGTMNASTTTILTNGVVKGEKVSFQTPRHETSYPKGKIAFTIFSGKLSGDTIKGTIQIYVDDKLFSSRDWKVKRVKE